MDDECDLIARLFAQEIPEVTSGQVEIMGIARSVGYRTKMAVRSHDPRVDCIGVCVGNRGRRIKAIVDRLGFERIDLLRWSDSPEQMIASALQPAAIEKVTLYPAQHRALVIVKADQLSLVHGRGGINRELASRLCCWQIDIEVLPA
jgi:transcription termination/antitermination protein NusA